MYLKKNYLILFFVIVIINFFISPFVFAHEAASEPLRQIGGFAFNQCYFCHSLKPDVHLTGPSLANLWGKKAGNVKGFELYSDALKKSNITWNEKSLEKWIRDAQKFAPGTTMPNIKYSDEKDIQSIVDFFKIAMKKDGYQKIISEKLIDEKLAIGQLPKHIRHPENIISVKSVDSCGSGYSVELTNGTIKKIWKLNLGLKVMSGEFGPKENQPILVPTGSMGDRFDIIFHSLKELSSTITDCKATQKNN